LVKKIIFLGAEINATDGTGSTPLHEACFAGNQVLVNLLLENNANVYAVDNTNKSPLHLACQEGKKEIVAKLLTCSVNYNTRAEGVTPLMAACKANHHELIPLLLAKTELSIEDISAKSALTTTITCCDVNTQKQFLDKALRCYLADRKEHSDYLNWWNVGFSKDEKMAAAGTLLNAVNGTHINLKPHHAALSDGRLASMYGLYQKMQTSKASLSAPHQDKPHNSNVTMHKLLGPTNVSPKLNCLTSKKQAVEATVSDISEDLAKDKNKEEISSTHSLIPGKWG